MIPTPNLKAAALAATPGPWQAFDSLRTGTFAVHTNCDPSKGDIVGWLGFDGNRVSKKQSRANAKFIALANPATILALIERLQVAEDAVKRASIGSAELVTPDLIERIAQEWDGCIYSDIEDIDIGAAIRIAARKLNAAPPSTNAKDAERYRHVRDNIRTLHKAVFAGATLLMRIGMQLPSSEKIDAVIDDDIAAKEPK